MTYKKTSTTVQALAVLVSTSRHLTQGMIDVVDETWNNTTPAILMNCASLVSLIVVAGKW